MCENLHDETAFNKRIKSLMVDPNLVVDIAGIL